ncbi:hypothetical protein A5844_002132 [Enterococcus sp. 10A9_DIV0425]|uniref:Uncharacterized protein n=1 Tax=Candidatus Enterococcus wittei TaxID=1987383 RepID=A0A242JYX5_9ENTE|nr:hypothetical protein A5844_002132 [Enterococcus sp. 10A9_DIV0425]
MNIAFQIFCEFQSVSEGVASALAVYVYLGYGTKVNSTIVPYPFK